MPVTDKLQFYAGSTQNGSVAVVEEEKAPLVEAAPQPAKTKKSKKSKSSVTEVAEVKVEPEVISFIFLLYMFSLKALVFK